MLVYATEADLATWTGAAAPTNAVQLLRIASGLVRRATMTSVYLTDATGLPTDAATLQAFQDATCAQAATWAALALDPVKGAADDGVKVVTNKSLGSGSISYAVSPATVLARASAATDLSMEASLILWDAGLLTTPPLEEG